MPVGDLISSPPARIEASTAGEERGARDGRTLKSPKLATALRKDAKPPEIELDPGVELEKEERHKLDERA
jgi:hypothetical protein